MIKQVTNNKTFLKIIDKLDDVPDCKLIKSKLYSFMVAGEYNKHTYAFASFEGKKKDEMNGCEVITLNNDLNGVLTLSVIFLWISPRYRKLWKEYRKFTEKRALQYKCKKISFTTSRSEKAIDKHLGKYGYSKAYNVIENKMS